MNSIRKCDHTRPASAQRSFSQRCVIGVLVSVPLVVLFSIVGFQLVYRPVKPIEVPRSDLVLRDGLLYRKGESNTFTGGMIERYNSGSLKSRSSVMDGRLHGVSEGWHPNGQLQVLEHFQAGVSEGLRTKYYPSGRKQSEGRIVAGQFNGTYRRWHENGYLAEQVEFRDGRADGVSFSYFETGLLKARVTLRNGAVLDHLSWNNGEVALPTN